MAEEFRELSSTTYERVRIRDVRFRWIDVSGAQVRNAGLRDTRLRGLEVDNVDDAGELTNVVINGVEVGPLVEAELVRLDPDYAKMRPSSADEFREAWEILERRWSATVEHARALDPELLHESVDGE